MAQKLISINRYIGLNSKHVFSYISEEYAILKQLRQLKKLKTALTQKNTKKPKYRQGFSSNYHNFKHDNGKYSTAEKLFKKLLDKHNVKYVHEYRVKLKDFIGKTHNYYIDFYIPEVKLAIEINPLFHYTYESVKIRDKLKARLLKRRMHIKTIDIKAYIRVKQKNRIKRLITTIDNTKALNLIQKIKRMKPNKETLIYWISVKR